MYETGSFYFKRLSICLRVCCPPKRIIKILMASADWIAHDILDSIVDSFFPFLESIEMEAVAIDEAIFSGSLPAESPKSPRVVSIITERTRINNDFQWEKYADKDEKFQYSPRLRFVVPHLTVSLMFHRIKRFISNAWKSCTWTVEPPPTPIPSQLTLRRIGSTRKLVTSLVRLLGTKSDVLTAFRKRLMRTTVLKHKSTPGRSSDELTIYSGDVQG